MLVPIGISNRHTHVSKKDADVLFGEGYEFQKLKDLSQHGQFANVETVSIVGPRGRIDNVRILGPFRNDTQVEILMGDTYALGVDAPIRLSGHLDKTPGVTMIGPKGTVQLEKGVIVAQRHIHCDTTSAQEHNLVDGQVVKVKVAGDRGVIFENVLVRIHDTFALDCHLDLEEGNAAGIKGMVQGEVIV